MQHIIMCKSLDSTIFMHGCSKNQKMCDKAA